MKIFEDHQRKEGKPVSHQFAKELIAGFAAGEVDKLCETKGADYIEYVPLPGQLHPRIMADTARSREKAKRHARENAEQMYDDHYGDQGKSPTPYPGSCAVTNSSTDQYNPNQQQPNDRLQQQFGRW